MLTASYACMNYVMYIVFNWFFYYLVEVREFSLVDAGFVTSAQWIAGAIGAAAGGWFCDRLCRTYGLNWGCRLPIAIGMIASAVLLLGGAFSPNQTAAMIMLALCFFFNQAVEGPYWATSMAVGGRYAGSAGGLMNTGGNTMGIVNALLVPWLALVFGWEVAVSSGAFFALLGTVLLLFVRPDQSMDVVGQE
jgi:ACS family glucarate transporter-like MFS transporter